MSQPKPHSLWLHPRPYERVFVSVFPSRSAATFYALETLKLPRTHFHVRLVRQLPLFPRSPNNGATHAPSRIRPKKQPLLPLYGHNLNP